MRRAAAAAMAVAAHKIVIPSASALAFPSRTASESLCRPSSATPILRPWWRSLSQALPISSVALRQSAQGSRTMVGVARATAEAEGSEASTSETEETAPVHLKTKILTKKAGHIMQILNDEAVAAARKDRSIPDLRTGDIVAMRVEVPENKQRISLIRGIVIAKRNAGINSTFRIRRVLAGVGVEMVFPLYSPNIKELKVVDRRKVRRAKLYYLRDKIAKLSTVN